MAAISVQSGEEERLAREMFTYFTKKEFVLYKFIIIPAHGKPTRQPFIYHSLDPLDIHDGMPAIKEPAVVRPKHGWESQYVYNYRELGVGEIKEFKTLVTFEEVVNAGPEFVREFLGVMVDRLAEKIVNNKLKILLNN